MRSGRDGLHCVVRCVAWLPPPCAGAGAARAVSCPSGRGGQAECGRAGTGCGAQGSAAGVGRGCLSPGEDGDGDGKGSAVQGNSGWVRD